MDMERLPNAAEAHLAEAIRLIAARGFESALLGLLRRAVGIDNLLVLAYRDGARPQVLYHHAGRAEVFAELETTYVAGAYLLDPFHDLHLHRAPAGLYRLLDIAPDQFQRSRYFREYYRRTTITDELTFVAYPARGVSLNICLGRDATSGGAFAAREIAVAQRIAPVVVALAERHWAGLRPTGHGAGDGAGGDPTAALRRDLAEGRGVALSPRQAEVALMILRGHSSMSIGLRLGVSAQTVKVFRKQLYRRCGISSQAELFALMMPLLKGREAPSGPAAPGGAIISA
jgi:DNA-binding CsgD family transcriptional regulator